MHIVFIPVVRKSESKSGKQIEKIACSEYWKGKDSYRKLQDEFYKYIVENGFDLERGKARGIEHLSTEKLKQVTNYKEIREEIQAKPTEKIETKNTKLIVDQNQLLIENNRKLKKYLAKAYTAISETERIKKENAELKCENEKLKKQNNKLREYIKRTFEVLKVMFNFPIDSLKRIIQNYVHSIDKQ